jgi:hypothetical protein
MFSTYVYAVIGIGGGCWKLALVNYAMTIYDQAEIGPIFSAFFIVFQISAGIFIADEESLYKFGEMVMLLIYSFICILGIILMTRKNLLSICIKNRVVFGYQKGPSFSEKRQLIEMGVQS